MEARHKRHWLPYIWNVQKEILEIESSSWMLQTGSEVQEEWKLTTYGMEFLDTLAGVGQNVLKLIVMSLWLITDCDCTTLSIHKSENIELYRYFLGFIFLFLERGKGGKKKGKKHQCVVASHAPPYWGHDPQPRHVPWLGIEPVTFCVTSLSSIHWAIPARVSYTVLNEWIICYINSNS